VLGRTDEAAVDEASASLSGVRVPRAVRVGLRAGAALGALPGVWLAVRGARLDMARGASWAETAGTVAFALCLVAAAGTLVGGALGALAGAGIDAARDWRAARAAR
jgi:branched-subunit amino acid ABC-type transport system permease component